jgi:hypothetical protein
LMYYGYRKFCALQSGESNMLWITRKHPQHIVVGQHRPLSGGFEITGTGTGITAKSRQAMLSKTALKSSWSSRCIQDEI